MTYLITSCLVLSLAGCSMVPVLERPAAPIPARYQDAPAEAENGADLGWRQMFSDA